MIDYSEFKVGKKVYYSDQYEKSYAIIELLKVTKRKGKYFWFDAKIIDNSNITPGRGKWFDNGNISSFSNAFIYNTYDELKKGSDTYKETQIDWLTKKYLKK